MRLLICIVLAAASLAAQAPRGIVFWWDMPLVKDLNLTDDQSGQIRGALREHRTKLVDLRAALEKAELELEDAFSADQVDQRRAGDAIERVIRARGDLAREVSQLALRLRLVLTPTQWKELQKRLPDGPPPPPGPPGGPGRPPGKGPRGPRPPHPPPPGENAGQ